jgi:hypothetical protein
VQEIDFGLQVFAARSAGRSSRTAAAFLGEMRAALDEPEAMPPRSRTGT